MSWLFLASAIACEVGATSSLKLSDGFTRPLPSLIVVIGYSLSFVMLSQALSRGMTLAVAYGVWSAVGIALLSGIGAVVFGERMGWAQMAGVALLVVGVVLLQLGSDHPR